MHVMGVDIETYSDVDLKEAGVYAYAESLAFEILLIGYRIDDGPVQVIDLGYINDPRNNPKEKERLLYNLSSGGTAHQEFRRALTSPEYIKTAYNANFERTCLAVYFKEPMPPGQWQCTAVLAATLGLPGTLEAVGKALGLPEDKQKDKIGKSLIQYFCKP